MMLYRGIMEQVLFFFPIVVCFFFKIYLFINFFLCS